MIALLLLLGYFPAPYGAREDASFSNVLHRLFPPTYGPHPVRGPVVNRSRTPAELQYQEVLNNIAMMESRDLRQPVPPEALSGPPRFDAPGLRFYYTGKSNAELAAAHLNPALIGPETVLGPDQLVILEYAYQKAIGFRLDIPTEERLAAFFEPQPRLYAALRSGWFGVGNATDVPDAVSYVGQYGGTYVWVFSTDVASLAQFTFAVNYVARMGPRP